MKKVLLITVFFISMMGFSQAQEMQITKTESKKELIFFSNNGCGKCEQSQVFFDKNNMPYQKYSIKENRPLMYEYVHKKTRGKNVGVGYPVLVYGDSIYFSIKNISATLNQIKKMMEEDKNIKVTTEAGE